jgi:hypothetical protein
MKPSIGTSLAALSRAARRMGFSRLALLFLLLTVTNALAQNGTVSGHVVDSAGLAVPDATVTITSNSTNVVYEVRTNGEGYYQFPPLVPGNYVAKVTAKGFEVETIGNVTLEVGGSLRIDAALKLGSVTQDVLVTASAPELVVDNPDRGNVIESEFVQNIPLNIRNPLQMVNFAQGVTAYSTDSGNNDNSESLTNTFRINGGKLATTESLLDGGVNTTQYDLNAIAAVPQVDSIQEFKVITDAYSPEYGHTSGGVVTFSTKSGTDRLHGTVYDYIRNSDTDANTFNANQIGSPLPHLERNQYGYATGGPVAFPPHFRSPDHKTFFFQSYEGLRQTTAVLPSSETYTVPTALERTGDFSHTFDSAGNLIKIYDPSTTTLQPAGSTACTATPVTAGQTVYCRTPFAGNKIPNLDAAGKAIIASYPMPNQPGQGLSSVNNFLGTAPQSSNQDTVNLRVDHKFSDKHSIFFRYDWFQRFNFFGDPYGDNLSPTSNHQRLPGDNVMLDHTWVITPAIVLEHHFVRAHQESNRIPETLGFNPAMLGFASNVTSGLQTTTFPEVKSATRVSALGPQSGNEADAGTTYEYGASLSWLKGKHSLKFGFDYRDLIQKLDVNQLVSLSTNTANTSFTGGPNAQSAGVDSGDGIADILLGTAAVTSGFVPGLLTVHPYYAFYAMDEYHITPKLTLTYGLRYSIEFPDLETHNQFQYLNLTSTSPLSGQTSLGTLTGGPGFVGVDGAGQRLSNPQYTNFDPRLGFAYGLNNKTVVRGGFGLFHAPSFLWLSNSTSQGYSEPTTSIAAQTNGVVPLYNMDNPFPSGLIPITGNSLGLDTNVGLPIAGYPRNQINSYSAQWSVDVQRQLPDNFVVTAGYVANAGVHLYTPFNYNQLPDSDLALGTALQGAVANPFYGVVTQANSPLSKSTVQAYQLLLPHPQFGTMTSFYDSRGHSSYNSMQVTVEHRFSQGLSILGVYTYSRMFDNVGDYFSYLLGATGFTDNYCPSCDRSISNQDLKNVLRASGEYELPFGQGKPFLTNRWASQVVGGWSLGIFYTFDTGLPVQITESNNTNLFGGGSPMRPNIVRGVPLTPPGGRHIKIGPANTASLYFNPVAFSQAPAFTYGNAPRYIDGIRAPGTDNFDMHVEKQIPLHEELALKFRVEFFNAFNHPQFAAPSGASIGNSSGAISPTFGDIVPSQANNPRELQGSLRLSF